MEFESAGPAIVRSIKQRDLLNTWLRLYARNERIPELSDYQPERIADEIDDLVFYNVTREDGAPTIPHRERRHPDVKRLRDKRQRPLPR